MGEGGREGGMYYMHCLSFLGVPEANHNKKARNHQDPVYLR
jgi:hypothetical protein